MTIIMQAKNALIKAYVLSKLVISHKRKYKTEQKIEYLMVILKVKVFYFNKFKRVFVLNIYNLQIMSVLWDQDLAWILSVVTQL